MSEIKSEKAIKYLNRCFLPRDMQMKAKAYSRDMVNRAIILSEIELTERHVKELQELKDKAVEAFKLNMNYWNDGYTFPQLNDFISELNK